MSRLRPVVALTACLFLLIGFLAPVARAETIWRFNLYRSSAYVRQDPYPTACTAAAAMTMLNLVALNQTGGAGFHWQVSRTKHDPNPLVYTDMASILYFERAHDTLAGGQPGSDPHGWRNALNYYGWGSAAMTSPASRVYQDRAYTSFDAALHAAVVAVARTHLPVGMLGRAGGHAQVITGYVVTGDDPTTSDDFFVNALYISDPLASSHLTNGYVSRGTLLAGDTRYRFRPYYQADSPADDPYTPGWRRSSSRTGSSEWYGRRVLIVPTRALFDLPNPTPTPTPTPPPSSDPTPSPTPSQDPAASSDATSVDAGGGPSPTATPTDPPSSPPTATPSDPPTPSADPTPTPAVTPAPTATSTPDPSADAGASSSPDVSG